MTNIKQYDIYINVRQHDIYMNEITEFINSLGLEPLEYVVNDSSIIFYVTSLDEKYKLIPQEIYGKKTIVVQAIIK